VVVSSFGLDGLDYYCARWEVVGCDETLDVCEGFGFGLGVLLNMVFERVFEEGESGLWPVECGDIEFVDWFGTCS